MAQPEIKEKEKSQHILMSNIKIQKFHGFNFYHTICSKARYEQKGLTYESPQQRALDKVKAGDIVLCIKNEKGSAYGSMPFEDLEMIYKQNHYLYELLPQERKFYLDIEFPFETKEDSAHKLALIFKLVKRCFIECGVNKEYARYNSKRDFFSKVIGVGEQGGFKNVNKFSAHLIYNNGCFFKSVCDIYKFSRYMKQIINDTEEYRDLIFETDTARDYAIDFGVYTKNRLFKLPYQSKPNSNRIQTPSPKTPADLESCLISNPIKEGDEVDVSHITLKTEEKSYSVKNKAGRIIGHNISNNVATFLEEFKRALPVDCDIPEGDADSGSLEYIVKSIYNGKSVEWSCFCAVGMAIKRASGGSGFDLWVEWAKKSGKPQNISEMRGLWGRFSLDRGYGFLTLLNMAKLCNPALISQQPHRFLFDMPHNSNTKIVNRRFLNENDFESDNQIIYIKSPMGTGKSYNIHKIQNQYKRIVYLSSKRAFATAMGKEFEEDGFKNYIDLSIEERYDEPKLIISLESFHQINPDNIDLLIIDESESIFNVIGSHTLQVKGEGLNNLLVFEKAIRTAKKVLVMDAFLSRRSFNAIKTIRPNASSELTVNEWKPAKRFAEKCKNKEEMWANLKSCLEAGERCVVVSGSKKFAIHLVLNALAAGLVKGDMDQEGIYTGEDVKLYHSANPLDLSTKVETEWSKCKLLIYSPTITCGVSYTNDDALFDRLFVYMPNKFSACFRDATQALKRVRKFTKDKMYLCLNVSGRYNLDMSPVYFDKVKELIYTWKSQIFTDEKHYISLQTTDINEYKPLKNWVSEARIYNILEANISGIFLEKVAKTYLNIENIHIIEPIEHLEEGLVPMDGVDFPYEKVIELDFDIDELIKKRESMEHITTEEYYFMIFHDFKKSLKDNISDFNKALFWNFYMRTPERRSRYYSTIKFNKLIKNKSIESMYEKADGKKILELNTFYDERYSHLFKMFRTLGIINEDNEYNLDKDFMKEDLEPLLEDYKALRMKGGLKAFNQLLKFENIRDWGKNEDDEECMNSDKMYIMVKHLAIDLLGINCERIKQKKRRILVDGVKKQVFFGVFKFSHPRLQQNFYDVMSVAHDKDENELDIKPSDWMNDSGITSEEECEDI